MTIGSQTWTEEIVEAAGAKIQLIKAGMGEPLLVLHDEMGHPGWLGFHRQLAEHHTLHIPSHPGYGKSSHLDWIMTVRDLAGWYLDALDDLGLGGVNVMGLSMGGWIAAEMAAVCPHQFSKLVLVGAPGIRPPAGEVLDMFLLVAQEFLTAGVLDPTNTQEFKQICPDEPAAEQVEAWEVAREETCRLTWRPYMYDQALPHLLRRLKGVPSLIVWGRQDAVVPLSVGEAYHESIQGSRLAILDSCGHRPEIEKPGEFARLVLEFLSG